MTDANTESQSSVTIKYVIIVIQEAIKDWYNFLEMESYEEKNTCGSF